ncbi:hypothetical protein [Microvirga puerhi]|uniref:YbgF trimerisation domain-containing protein n=1 Tax=Microvirga puerhi TaxID=2876078 RepID=A0ABS7VTK4_9HYPH|nr:hypothetical protein [Microvirga puerhi]MBZ6078902.1 hypothetical protein [Microvirga puerhi]
MRTLVAAMVICLACPAWAADPVNAPTSIAPIVKYVPDRSQADLEKYNDPILQKGVDISAIEIEVLRRRLSQAEERVELLEKNQRQSISALNQVIEQLNTVIKAQKK